MVDHSNKAIVSKELSNALNATEEGKLQYSKEPIGKKLSKSERRKLNRKKKQESVHAPAVDLEMDKDLRSSIEEHKVQENPEGLHLNQEKIEENTDLSEKIVESLQGLDSGKIEEDKKLDEVQELKAENSEKSEIRGEIAEKYEEKQELSEENLVVSEKDKEIYEENKEAHETYSIDKENHGETKETHEEVKKDHEGIEETHLKIEKTHEIKSDNKEAHEENKETHTIDKENHSENKETHKEVKKDHEATEETHLEIKKTDENPPKDKKAHEEVNEPHEESKEIHKDSKENLEISKETPKKSEILHIDSPKFPENPKKVKKVPQADEKALIPSEIHKNPLEEPNPLSSKSVDPLTEPFSPNPFSSSIPEESKEVPTELNDKEALFGDISSINIIEDSQIESKSSKYMKKIHETQEKLSSSDEELQTALEFKHSHGKDDSQVEGLFENSRNSLFDKDVSRENTIPNDTNSDYEKNSGLDEAVVIENSEIDERNRSNSSGFNSTDLFKRPASQENDDSVDEYRELDINDEEPKLDPIEFAVSVENSSSSESEKEKTDEPIHGNSEKVQEIPEKVLEIPEKVRKTPEKLQETPEKMQESPAKVEKAQASSEVSLESPLIPCPQEVSPPFPDSQTATIEEKKSNADFSEPKDDKLAHKLNNTLTDLAKANAQNKKPTKDARTDSSCSKCLLF